MRHRSPPQISDALPSDNAADAALLAACAQGEEKAVRWALAAGADVNARNAEGETALLLVSKLFGSKRLIPTVECLLEAGADSDAADSHGRTALMMATGPDDADLCRLLLDSGARLTTTDSDGDTPLAWAVIHEAPAIVRLLLEAGADCETTNRLGQRPVDLCDAHEFDQEDMDAIRTLLWVAHERAELRRSAAPTAPLAPDRSARRRL